MKRESELDSPSNGFTTNNGGNGPVTKKVHLDTSNSSTNPNTPDYHSHSNNSFGVGDADANGDTNESEKKKISRLISACRRCRSRKIKCDKKFPSCSHCVKVGVACMGVDAATGREIPRSYVSFLENRVSQLEAALKSSGLDLDATNGNNNNSGKDTGNDTPNTEVVSEGSGPGNMAVPLKTHEQSSSQTSGLNPADGVELMSVRSSSTHSSQNSVLGASSGLSFSRILFTAVKLRVQGSPYLKPSTSSSKSGGAAKVKVRPALLPPKNIAETLLSSYFAQANSQLPVLHREHFIKRYFEPIYGKLSPNVSLASDFTKIALNMDGNDDSAQELDRNCYYYTNVVSKSLNGSESRSVILGKPKPELYFLNIIFGIATSIHQQQYPADMSESYRVSAAHHFESVFSSSDRLEALQGVLLLTLYSVMRPAVPGVWYTLGTALRLCVDLGLHQEDFLSRKGGPMDFFTVDMRRRLFWCTYMLDRQICVYLGRPVGIPESSITAKFPSEFDDSYIVEGNQRITGLKAPSYKKVSLSFIKIRQIQGEAQRILYECAELPRQFSTFDEWATFISAKLDEWRQQCPTSLKEMNCAFNQSFFDLNFYQTRLLIYGISPRVPTPKPEAYLIIADAGLNIISRYIELHRQRSINYTWVAVHNLFIAATSYLFALYHSPLVRSRTSVQEIEKVCESCIVVLSTLKDRCDAAVPCKNSFELLSAAIIKLVHNEKTGIVMKNGVGSAAVDPVSQSLPSINEIAKSQVSNYVHPHLANLLNTLPAATTDSSVRLAPQQVAPRTSTPLPATLDASSFLMQDMAGFNHLNGDEILAGDDGRKPDLWPVDMDSFFKEAAEVSSSSPSASTHNSVPISTNWHQVYDPLVSASQSPSSPRVFEENLIQSQQDSSKRLYNLINDVPLTPIWDQFFAPQTSFSYSNVSSASTTPL